MRIIIRESSEESLIRTYKNNSITYDGKKITSVDFESLISDKNHDLHWISKCSFKDALIITGDKKTTDFYHTLWLSGEFEGSNMMSSRWKNGIFNGVNFEKSIWHKGEFRGHLFDKSTWKDGIFNGIHFSNSTWEDGIFNGGTDYRINGNWKKFVSSFRNSIWVNGTFNSGEFESDSVWKDGIWIISDSSIFRSKKYADDDIKMYKFNVKDSKAYSFIDITETAYYLTKMEKYFATQTHNKFLNTPSGIISYKDILKKIDAIEKEDAVRSHLNHI